jgi:uncharacterized protein YnzC (UPF0291/DUF896 family)
MEQKKIDRINELSRKARTPEGLTEAEQQERAALRGEYVRAVVGNLDSQLSHTVLVDAHGNRRRLRKKEEEQA